MLITASGEHSVKVGDQLSLGPSLVRSRADRSQKEHLNRNSTVTVAILPPSKCLTDDDTTLDAQNDVQTCYLYTTCNVKKNGSVQAVIP